MSLEEFYDEHNIDDRCIGFKKILIVLPSKEFCSVDILKRLWLSKYECHFTYPKISDKELLKEINLIDCNLVIQIGRKFSKKYPYVLDTGWSPNLKEKIDKALGDVFVNLHHHDEFSIRDGLGKVEDLVNIIKERKGAFCSVTNHGSLGGWIRQYNSCNGEGIKPIFGMEAYYQKERDITLRQCHHLVILVKTQEGYENLIKIHNEAQINGFYYSPRTCYESLKKWGKGLAGTSSCLGGEIPQYLMNDQWDEARQAVERYKEVFDEFYIELTMIEMKEQVEINKKLVKLSEEMSIPVLLTLDSHYLRKEHCETHDLLMLIRDRKTINDARDNPEEVWQFEVKNLYYKTGEEVFETFREGFHDKDGNFYKHENEVFHEGIFWEGYLNTRGFCLTCEDIKIESKAHLPKIYDNSEDIIKLKAKEGYDKLGLKGKIYGKRLRSELEVICKLNFDSYFLIVADIIEQTVKEHGEFSIGMGRGSCAGSLVSYCLGITGIDPIKYGLLFERFLDYDIDENGGFIPHSYPDIDLDFKPDVREWVKDYITDKYKGENTCSIGTYQTYRTRGVLIDVAKALGFDQYEIMNITTHLGDLNFDAEEDAVDDLPFETIMKYDKKLEEYIGKRPEVLRHSKILRNQIKSMGKHAGGMIISDMNLQDKIPVVQNREAIVSSWAESGTRQELSSVGLVKFDILGLKNLKIIQDCLNYIKDNKGKEIKKSDIPIDDEESIRQSSKNDLVGIFQFENPTTKPIADKVRMDSLNDISAVTSLIRPGPRAMGMHLAYANRKCGREKFTYLPGCEEFLKDTYAVITYQEQIMLVAQKFANFTPHESTKLRKILTKSHDKKGIKLMREKFLKGADFRVKKDGISIEQINYVFDQLASFASYGFCKSHAVAYSAITATEFWLKYNFKLEYMIALLNNTVSAKKAEDTSLINKYVNYCRKNDMVVMPPNINKSGGDFIIENDGIRMSLGCVKNFGTMAELVTEFQPFSSVEDFYSKIDKRKLNKGKVYSLICADAFRDFGDRNEIVERYNKLRKVAKKDAMACHTDEEWIELEKEILSDISFSEEVIRNEYYLIVRKKKWNFIDEIDNKKICLVFGKIESIVPKKSKAGNSMYYCNLSDGMDKINFYVFKNEMKEFKRNFKAGYIVVLNMDKFNDGNVRFYSSRNKSIIINKGEKK